MAYVGTRGPFERPGFSWAAGTTSVLSGFPRVAMRLPLTAGWLSSAPSLK